MRTIILTFFITFLTKASFSQSEISLYDKGGNPVAYLATNDNWTIYLWNGKPLAYIFNDNQTLHIYGFNGKHLGWYINGIIRDHDGNVVGFKKGAVANIYEKHESYKEYKEYKPFQSYREYAPYQPYLSTEFSSINLNEFLFQGISDETTHVNRQVYKAPDPIMETDLDLLAKVNMTKQALFDQRTKNVQEVINQISYYLKGVLKYDKIEYAKQYSTLKSNVNKISTTPIDYSDINQYNQIIVPLNSHLNIVQSKLRELQIIKTKEISVDTNSVVVHKDEKLDLLIKKQSYKNEEPNKDGRKTDNGFRLVVISTNNLDEAMAAKTKIYTYFPELKAYLWYQSPYFRVKAGNFKDRKDAEAYQRSINTYFPKGVFIMEDTIEVKLE